VKSGAVLSYDMLVLNLGPKTAEGVVIRDVIPVGTTFVSAGFESLWCALVGGCGAPSQMGAQACTVSGRTVVCDAGSLKPLSLLSTTGIGVQVLVRVNAPAGTTLVNTATVSSSTSDPKPGNNTVTWQTVVKK
jgi:uncharacterized repeat protein (TIGR01451 family)